MWLPALITFSVVSAITPGPNNILLWASGARFGLRATLPHVLGTALGIGLMALAVAAGLGALVTAVDGVALALRIAGSLYLLWLAYQIATSGPIQGAQVARPFGLARSVGFQCLNPKAWIFALAAMSAFRPTGVPVVAGSLLVAATMMVVIAPAAAVWAAGGTAIGRFLSGGRAHRVMSMVLALLLAASIAQLWI